MNLKHPFVMDLSSLDPKFNHDGLPYGPWQFDNISKECYLISKSIKNAGDFHDHREPIIPWFIEARTDHLFMHLSDYDPGADVRFLFSVSEYSAQQYRPKHILLRIGAEENDFR